VVAVVDPPHLQPVVVQAGLMLADPAAILVAAGQVVVVQEAAVLNRAAGHHQRGLDHQDNSGVEGDFHETSQISRIPFLVEAVAVGTVVRDREAADGGAVVRMVLETEAHQTGDSHRHRHGTCLTGWHHWVTRSQVQFRRHSHAPEKSMDIMPMSQTPAKCTMSAFRNRSSITRSFATRAPYLTRRTRRVSKSLLVDAHLVIEDNDRYQWW
jgi:hypothetical protein